MAVEGCEWLEPLWDVDGDVVNLAVTIAWLVWFAWNSSMNKGTTWNAYGIIDKAMRILEDFNAANLPVFSAPNQSPGI